MTQLHSFHAVVFFFVSFRNFSARLSSLCRASLVGFVNIENAIHFELQLRYLFDPHSFAVASNEIVHFSFSLQPFAFALWLVFTYRDGLLHRSFFLVILMFSPPCMNCERVGFLCHFHCSLCELLAHKNIHFRYVCFCDAVLETNSIQISFRLSQIFCGLFSNDYFLRLFVFSLLFIFLCFDGVSILCASYGTTANVREYYFRFVTSIVLNQISLPLFFGTVASKQRKAWPRTVRLLDFC